MSKVVAVGKMKGGKDSPVEMRIDPEFEKQAAEEDYFGIPSRTRERRRHAKVRVFAAVR